MNKLFLFLACVFNFLLSSKLFSQEQESYYPRILIVSPTVFEYDAEFEEEMTKIREYVLNYGLFKDDLEKHPPNVKRTMESVSNFSKTSSESGILPLLITERILFTMFRGKRNFVFLMDTCRVVETGDALTSLAKKYDVQHIIYFPEVKLTKSGELGKAILSIKVYNAHSNSISLTMLEESNWDYDEEDENPELLREKTAIALIHNASFPLWFRILTNIYDTNESYKVINDQIEGAKENDKEEYEVFYEDNDEEKYIKEGLSKCVKQARSISPDIKSLNQIFQTKSNPYSTKSVFQVVFNKENSKFIAFCIDSAQPTNALSGFIKQHEDVGYYCSKFGLISSSNTMDSNTFYGSLIRGIKEGDQWFFDQVNYSKFKNRSKKDCQTIMLANLYYWGYLDTGYQSLFGYDDDGLFGSPSRFNSDRFPYEGLQFWDNQKREYVLPENMTFIEANDRIRETKEFGSRFTDQRIKPFYEKILKVMPEDMVVLLYSPDRTKVIHPYFDSGQQKLRYFLFVENSVFEWKCPYNDNHAVLKDQIVAEFNRMTIFDYGDYLVLGDEQFWNTKVFLKDVDSYKFLSEIRM